MGNIQRCDEAGVLTMAAHVGFERPFLEFFAHVDSHTDSACGAAMATRQRVIVNDISANPLFADAPSLPVMLTAGVRAVQSTPLFDRSDRVVGLLSTYYRGVHHFTDVELKWLDLLARDATDLINRQRIGEELEQRVADRTKWLTLMHEVTRALNDGPRWDEGLNFVLRRVCEVEHYVGDERLRPFAVASEGQRYARGQSLPGKVYGDGLPLWLDAPEQLVAPLPIRGEVAKQVGLRAAGALPIRFGRDVIAVMELFSDQPHPPNELLANLMNDVSAQIGKVLERERATTQMADLVWREQQGLLHTLHDSLGQTLTGLGMMSSGLRQQLKDTNPAAADTAQQVAGQAQLALEQVRQLSRGPFPVEVYPDGLLSALHELASTTETFHKVRLRVDGNLPNSIRDSRVATQLYRIAQEAVTTALKHAHANRITIELRHEAGLTRLRVVDDGIGMSKQISKSDGLGLRIMGYRATSIGALLSIAPGSGGGTMVSCTLRDTPSPTEPEAGQ